MQVHKRGAGGDTEKHWIKGVFLVVLWLLIFSMSRDFWKTRKGFLRIKATEDRLEAVRLQNLDLNQKLSTVSSDEYREKVIRDKLNMQKADEFVVILPKNIDKVMGQSFEEKELENWKKWMLVFGLKWD